MTLASNPLDELAVVIADFRSGPFARSFIKPTIRGGPFPVIMPNADIADGRIYCSRVSARSSKKRETA